MNIDLSDEELAFQNEARQFIAENYPESTREKVRKGLHLEKHDWEDWQRILYRKGWAAPNWPVAYGGTGWTASQRHIWEKACAEAYVLDVMAFGLKMVGPVIYTYGSEEQKKRFLPDILASKVWWCQGYSEANAGSDLASLRTTALRRDDHYLVNGTKTWTTLGQYADWIFCLVRTGKPEDKNQTSISFLLIDMTTPGITVSPIITLDGKHEVNEVHFDNVRVPAGNLIGEEGKGWTYAKLLLTHERTNIAKVAWSTRRLEDLKRKAARTSNGGVSLLDDSAFKLKVAAVEIELLALEYTELRTLAAVTTGQAPGPESSILKIKGTEVAQMIDELCVEAAGYYCLPFVREQFEWGYEGEWIGADSSCNAAPHYFNNRKASIYGGSNEIQRNIISKAVLQL
jgi:hypothetical protein